MNTVTQSLAKGAVGTALLHIERALAGHGTWSAAHSWVRAATAREIVASDSCGLYLGAPAIAFALHAAHADGTERYSAPLAILDAHVRALTYRRIERALTRIERRERAAFTEYDVFYGLTGIGAHLLAHDPGSDALGRVLDYLVRLSRPLRVDGRTLPGWWTFHGPNLEDIPEFRDGHANLGIAHGITGPLALLALAMRRGIVVDGGAEAIAGICAFLDTWQREDDHGTWWPQWVTLDELRHGRPRQRAPGRPSWCYGTPGLARAQQLAAIVTGELSRRRMAERALAGCLSDPVQLGRITDPGLCHGWPGLYQTAYRAAGDELTPMISPCLPRLAERLTHHTRFGTDGEPGLLVGAAGLALAAHTAARGTPPISGWDKCLMIS